MSLAIKNCCVPGTERMVVMDIFSMLESILKCWKNLRVSDAGFADAACRPMTFGVCTLYTARK